jgi:hypothetical protein
LFGVMMVFAMAPRCTFAQAPVPPVPNPCTPRFTAGSVVHQPPALLKNEREWASIASFRGEAETDVVGGPLAFGVAEVRAQGFLYFGDVRGALGGGQGRGEAFGKSFEPAGDVSGEWCGARNQRDVVHAETGCG